MKKSKKPNRRVLIVSLAAVLVIGILFASSAYVYNDLFGSRGMHFIAPRAFDGILEDEEYDPYFGSIYDMAYADNLQEFLRQWWYTGGDDMIRYSRQVLNILLMGIDDHDNADTILLVSINQRARTINLVSFLRDSYTYLNLDGHQRFHRLNSAYRMGGAPAVVEAIQRLYKIRIDHYAAIDMIAFPRLIDALGGVTVGVTPAEANFINNTAPSMNRSFPVGEGVHLNGAQALVFTRIRRLDSDPARVNRQQMVIESLINSARTASVGQIYNAIGLTLPFVYTDLSSAEITRMVSQGLTWRNFDIVNMIVPDLDYGPNRSGIPGTVHGMQVFIVDYPFAAQKVQLALYGETNINLDEGRGVFINNLFGSVTTQPPQPTMPAQNDDLELPPENDDAADGLGDWFDRIFGGTTPTQPPEEHPDEHPLPPFDDQNEAFDHTHHEEEN